jgi:hypothetical protein
MQRVHPLATLFDVFVRGMLPLQVWIDQFTSICEGRERLAKTVKCLAAHDTIARSKPYIYEMLKEGVQSRQELFFANAVPQSKYATKTN